jgi:hypothetical protein
MLTDGISESTRTGGRGVAGTQAHGSTLWMTSSISAKSWMVSSMRINQRTVRPTASPARNRTEFAL